MLDTFTAQNQRLTGARHMPPNKEKTPPKASDNRNKFSLPEYPPSIYDDAFWQYGADMSAADSDKDK